MKTENLHPEAEIKMGFTGLVRAEWWNHRFQVENISFLLRTMSRLIARTREF